MASVHEDGESGLVETSDAPPLSRIPSGVLYTSFNHREKLFLVGFGSMAAFLSPVTANIYYPAIRTLAEDLHVTVNMINLTITVYLIFQGFCPTLIGALSDAVGRRPAYMICFVLYLAANIGLSLQDSYPALMVLRCLQSSGSSGTASLSNAMVSDVVTSSERGTFIGYASIGVLLGPTIGPIIGGLLNQYLGWRAIFWFLVVLSAIIFILFLFFLPETCRAVVGNGLIPPQKWNLPFTSYLHLPSPFPTHSLTTSHSPNPPTPRLRRRPIKLLGTISIIFSKAGGCILLYTGLLFAGLYCIITSLPTTLNRNFGFDSLQIGLCYIPLGLGSMTSAICTGKALDWNFRRLARKCGVVIKKGKQTDLRDFPVEKARLQVIMPLMAAESVVIVIYGWVMEKTTSLAPPLVLLFFVGCGISGSFSALTTLIVDLYPTCPGTATAAANLVRCWMGAAAVAAIGPLTNKVGTGWVSVLIAGCWVIFSPLLWVVRQKGMRWREERRVRDEVKKKREEDREREEEKGEERESGSTGSKDGVMREGGEEKGGVEGQVGRKEVGDGGKEERS